MKKLRSFILTCVYFVSLHAGAAMTADTITVQGYMKKSNGTAVTSGTYNLALGLFKGGTVVWGKQSSVTITNGLFSVNLSGAGSNLTSLSAGTGMNGNYSALTLTPSFLESTGSGALTVRVYAISTIDGSNPQFDITYASSPSAFYAAVAGGVASGSVTLSAIASAAKTNSSAGASDAGKIALLDAAGKLSATMIPNLPASQITSGTISSANIDGVASSAGASDAGRVVILDGSGKIDSTMLPVSGSVDASTLTGTLPNAVFPGTLPTASAANLTNLIASRLTGTIPNASFPATLPAASGVNLTSLNAANLSGTLPSGVFPATLPAASAANLTNLPAANLSGTISSSNLSATDASVGAGDAGKVVLLDSNGLVSAASLPAASGANAGALTTGSQTIAGAKTFSAGITASGGVSGSLTGDVTGNLTGVAQYVSGRKSAITGGTTSAYTLTTPVAFTPVAGDEISFIVNAANAANPTLNVNSTSAAAMISRRTGAALAASDIRANEFLSAYYTGSQWSVELPELVSASTSIATCAVTTANTSGNCATTVTVTGAQTTHLAICSPRAALPNGYVYGGAWVSAANTVTIRMACNNTAACTWAATNFRCAVLR